jgi:hypothetical protein
MLRSYPSNIALTHLDRRRRRDGEGNERGRSGRTGTQFVVLEKIARFRVFPLRDADVFGPRLLPPRLHIDEPLHHFRINVRPRRGRGHRCSLEHEDGLAVATRLEPFAVARPRGVVVVLFPLYDRALAVVVHADRVAGHLGIVWGGGGTAVRVVGWMVCGGKCEKQREKALRRCENGVCGYRHLVRGQRGREHRRRGKTSYSS